MRAAPLSLWRSFSSFWECLALAWPSLSRRLGATARTPIPGGAQVAPDCLRQRSSASSASCSPWSAWLDSAIEVHLSAWLPPALALACGQLCFPHGRDECCGPAGIRRRLAGRRSASQGFLHAVETGHVAKCLSASMAQLLYTLIPFQGHLRAENSRIVLRVSIRRLSWDHVTLRTA